MKRKIHPPFAQPDPGRRASLDDEVEASADIEPSEEELNLPSIEEESNLPPIEQFLDELPSINEFLLPPEPSVQPITYDWSETSLYRPSPPAPQDRVVSRTPQRTTPTGTPDIDSEGWAVSDWQSYDWNTISSLGAPEPEAVEAHAAWSSTNWDAATKRLTGGLPVEQVAAALDEMARRIRSGELSLERFHGTPPEAAIAAVFAALLRTRG